MRDQVVTLVQELAEDELAQHPAIADTRLELAGVVAAGHAQQMLDDIEAPVRIDDNPDHGDAIRQRSSSDVDLAEKWRSDAKDEATGRCRQRAVHQARPALGSPCEGAQREDCRRTDT